MHSIQDIDNCENVKIDKAAHTHRIMVIYSQSAHPPV